MKGFLVVLLVFGALPLAHADEVQKSFLERQYGWYLDIPQGVSTFGFSWNITCPTDRQALPKEGGTAVEGVACRQEDRRFWTVVFWRVPSRIALEAVEKSVFRAMSGGSASYQGYKCKKQQLLPSDADQFGIIHDCSVTAWNGTTYVSYYHFQIPMPKAGEYVRKDGSPETDLAFTIWVQNADPNVRDPDVSKKLRELVAAIKIAN